MSVCRDGFYGGSSESCGKHLAEPGLVHVAPMLDRHKLNELRLRQAGPMQVRKHVAWGAPVPLFMPPAQDPVQLARQVFLAWLQRESRLTVGSRKPEKVRVLFVLSCNSILAKSPRRIRRSAERCCSSTWMPMACSPATRFHGPPRRPAWLRKTSPACCDTWASVPEASEGLAHPVLQPRKYGSRVCTRITRQI